MPEFGTSYSLPARVGYLRAVELILLAKRFDAKRALELGLVTAVAPDDRVFATALVIAQELSEKPVEALQACKRLMRQSTRDLLERAAKTENAEYAVRLRSPECKEALAAFLEKRPPDLERAKQKAPAA